MSADEIACPSCGSGDIVHVGQNTYKCPYCNSTFKHVEGEPSAVIASPQDHASINCHICGEVYNTKNCVICHKMACETHSYYFLDYKFYFCTQCMQIGVGARFLELDNREKNIGKETKEIKIGLSKVHSIRPKRAANLNQIHQIEGKPKPNLTVGSIATISMMTTIVFGFISTSIFSGQNVQMALFATGVVGVVNFLVLMLIFKKRSESNSYKKLNITLPANDQTESDPEEIKLKELEHELILIRQEKEKIISTFVRN